jgi:hypothetical protein
MPLTKTNKNIYSKRNVKRKIYAEECSIPSDKGFSFLIKEIFPKLSPLSLGEWDASCCAITLSKK